MRAQGVGPREARARQGLLARFGLAGREDERPDPSRAASSSASRSRARSPARPRALLLDEVTSALDPELVGEVLDVVRELKAEGMTMLIATHEMGFAREVADEVCFLHEGRILERGAPGADPRRAAAPETQRFLRRLLAAQGDLDPPQQLADGARHRSPCGRSMRPEPRDLRARAVRKPIRRRRARPGP